MFNVSKNKKDDNIKLYNTIYKDSFDIIYKDGNIEKFTGESTTTPSLYTIFEKDTVRIYSYKQPSKLDKIYLRNISDIDYIQYYKTEVI